jgi:anti-sigma factor RsiW
MNCQETELLIHGHLDDELDLAGSLEIERHLEECATCAAAHRQLLELRRVLRSGAPYHAAPARLRRRLEGRRSYAWMVAAAAAIVVSVTVWRMPGGSEQEVVAGHIRSLMANHLTDVASTDQHTVKPWFAGKLDFSPVVKDFGAQGFRLLGGRLDYLQDRTVAAVVYQRRAHTINVFMWPAQSDVAEKRSTRQGYSLISWTRRGIAFRVISDLNAAELEELVRLLR